ncbi:MAG: histidine phosphatase family protein [Nanoarchaeota archaeon]|nr:histidine phosphatase family protein [Nanoarchaeota archaeon]
MRILLTRHGETEENIKRIATGQLPGTLTKKGIEQAEKLGLRLKNEQIDQIYSSDLTRALDTAKIVAKHHPDVHFHITEEVRERDMGSYTGKFDNDCDWENWPDDIETNEEMQIRAKQFLDEIYQNHSNECVLIAAHIGFNQALISIINGIPANDMLDIKQSNACLNIIEYSENESEMIMLNNSDFL